MGNEKFYEEAQSIGDLIGIQLAPLSTILSIYPDEFLGMKFYEESESGARLARRKYTTLTQTHLIKAFQSHDWKFTSDIYGHNGLSRGGYCKNCKRKVKMPLGDWDDDFILTYHYLYGSQKRFGGRITKCKGK
jgi:hypothetical protein